MKVQTMNRLGFESEVLHNKMPVFLLLGAYCFNPTAEILDILPDYAEKYDQKMKFIYIDYDLTPDLVYYFDTPVLPILLTIEDGVVYERRDHPKSANDVREMVDRFFGVLPY